MGGGGEGPQFGLIHKGQVTAQDGKVSHKHISASVPFVVGKCGEK